MVISQICAPALVPDQLLPYVQAVAGLESEVCEGCLLHHAAGHGVLVGYPASNPENMDIVNKAVKEASKKLEHITVMACARPAAAPRDANVKTDQYWSLPLPAPLPGMKLRNMLKRGTREARIVASSGKAAWSADHAALVKNFSERKKLEAGSIYIFERLGDYLANTPDAVLFSAFDGSGKLIACAIGDYTAFATAFYMFAFRDASAPPGVADLLLNAVAREGETRGHSRLNLGLGIDSGVEFFKKKWQASPFLPYVETSWRTNSGRKGFFARLFGGKGG